MAEPVQTEAWIGSHLVKLVFYTFVPAFVPENFLYGSSSMCGGWHPTSVRFLDVALDMRKFRLPKDIVEYDQWLDKQAEELHKQQALKHSQGVQIDWVAAHSHCSGDELA